MMLRYQNKDEVDQEVEAQTRSSAAFWLIMGVLFAVLAGVWVLVKWLLGHPLSSHEVAIVVIGSLSVPIISLAGEYMIAPVYKEFRIRTKEIDGKLSAVESVINESKERNSELLERLAAIENRLDEIQNER
jgi:hypothetical protein